MMLGNACEQSLKPEHLPTEMRKCQDFARCDLPTFANIPASIYAMPKRPPVCQYMKKADPVAVKAPSDNKRNSLP